MPTNDAASRKERAEHRAETVEWRSARKTALWLGAAMVVALPLGVTIGFLTKNLTARMAAVFAIAIVSFMGTLLLAHSVAGHRPFDSGEMRMAIAASFVIVYFAVLAIFLFAISQPTQFAQDYVRNLTSLMGVIIAFFFASSAAVQYAKIRTDANPPAGPTPPPEPAPPAPEPPVDVVGEIARIAGSLAALQASHERLATMIRGREAPADDPQA